MKLSMNNKNYNLKVKKALKLIEDNPTSKQYFYNNAGVDANWFDALKDAGAFNFDSISNIRNVGEIIEYSRWVESEYLVRVTPDIPSKVLTLLLEYKTSGVENPIIREKLILITKILVEQLNEDQILPFIQRINNEKWFESTYLNLSPYELRDLIDLLVKKEYIRSLNILLPSVLKLLTPSKGSKYRQEPLPLFDVHTYGDILNSLSQITLELKNKSEFKILINILGDLLSNHIDIENNIRSRRNREDDNSTFWKPVINEKSDRSHRGLDEMLLDCISSIVTINTKLVNLKLILDLIKKHKYTVFKRLAIFVLTSNITDPNSIIDHIVEWMSDTNTKNEVRNFLIKHYNQLGSEEKVKILTAIDNLFDIKKLFIKRQNVIKQGWVKNEAELMTQIEVYVKKSRSDYIKPIAKYLTASQRTKYKQELTGSDDFIPYKFSTGGFKSGPNSRLSAQSISNSSIKDLVQLFKDDASWFIGNVNNSDIYSPLGVAREWESDILSRPYEYLMNLDLFAPSVELPPNYIYHLFNGFEKVALEKKIPLPQLMEFLTKLLKLYINGGLPEFPIKDDFEVGSWEETLIAILRFLEDAMKMIGVIDLSYSNTIMGVIKYALDSQSDSVIKSDEAEYSNLDYDSYAINSIYGLALHCLFRFSIWQANSADTKHSLSEEMKKAITHELTRGIKTTYSVIAHYFPIIFYADKDFAKKIKLTLFESADTQARYVALDAYLHNSVYKEVVECLSDSYVYFIDNIESLPNTEHGPSIVDRLIDHVMVIFVHGLPYGDKMKEALFKKSDTIKELAISFIGRAYISAEKKTNDLKVINHITKLWNECLTETNILYGKAFGWWIDKDFFSNTEWMLKQLIKTLKATSGVIDPDFRVLRTLADLSNQNPKLCLEALDLMIKGRDSEKTYYFRDGEISEIINNAESKNDTELNSLTDSIRNELVKYGFTQYRKRSGIS
jgi:hypothetical protein